ncbi:MAG: phosphopyruvate hydratase [Woeseia sp.]
MKTTIETVGAYRVWDSRGRPTVEVEVMLADGVRGRGIAPSGASCGANEAVDLRDGGSVFGGFGVQRALDNVHRIVGPAIIGMDAMFQATVDSRLIELDSTPNRGNIGGNALIATSMAVLHAAAAASRKPLWSYLADGTPASMPLPEVQIFGGGAHAGRRVDVQDFLVMPTGASTFDEALCICADIYRVAGEAMERRGGRLGVADEGGWWPNFKSNEDALQVLTEAIDKAGYGNGKAMISLDIAATELFADGIYSLAMEDRSFDSDDWLDLLCTWIVKYPILSIEDPVAENDVVGMRKFTAAVGDRIQVIGDDYLVTNADRVSQAIAEGCCNAVLIKPNQAGTITEARATLLRAQAEGWGTVISARSGESEDVTITHLAVGWNAGQLKVGSFSRSERMAKWNEALRIERGGGPMKEFAGVRALPVNWSGRIRNAGSPSRAGHATA